MKMDWYVIIFFESIGLKNRIMIYNFELEDTVDNTFADKIQVGIYEDWKIDFAEIK